MKYLEIMINSFQAMLYYDSLRTIIPNNKTPLFDIDTMEDLGRFGKIWKNLKKK